MANVLIWFDRALVEYAKLQEYLYEEWSEEIAQRVIKEIAQTVVRIENSPEHFRYLKTKKDKTLCSIAPDFCFF